LEFEKSKNAEKEKSNEGTSFERIGIYKNNTSYRIINAANMAMMQTKEGDSSEADDLENILFGRYKEKKDMFNARLVKLKDADKLFYSMLYTKLKVILESERKVLNTVEAINNSMPRLQSEVGTSIGEYRKSNMKYVFPSSKTSSFYYDLFQDVSTDFLNELK
jgi:hypothetical protein